MLRHNFFSKRYIFQKKLSVMKIIVRLLQNRWSHQIYCLSYMNDLYQYFLWVEWSLPKVG